MVIRALTSDVPWVSFLGLQTRYAGSLGIVAAAALVLVVPVLVRTREDLHAVVLATALMVVIVGLIALLQFAAYWQAASPGAGHWQPVGTLGNANRLGAVMAFGAPIGLYLWRAVPPPLVTSPVVLLLVVSTVVFLARSALGFLAAVAGAMVYLALQWWPAPWARQRRWIVAVAPALGHVVACAAVYLGHLVGLGSSTARVVLHGMATPLIGRAPLVGIGWGRFEAFHEQTRSVGAVTLGSSRELWADSSHDLLLDVAAETGLVGLALVLLVIAVAGLVLFRAERRLEAAGRDPSPVHLVAAWLVVSGVGLSLSVPMLILVWLWLLGLGLALAVSLHSGDAPDAPAVADSGVGGAGRTLPAAGPLVGVVAVVAAIVVVVAFLPLLRAAGHIGTADRIWLNEEWADSIVAGERASAAAPWWPRAWVVLGRAQEDAGELAGAAASYQAALDVDPRHRVALRRIPVVAGQLGQDGLAAAGFERAIVHDPQSFQIRLDQAEWALGTGQLDLARAALEHAAGLLDDGMEDWVRLVELQEELATADGRG